MSGRDIMAAGMTVRCWMLALSLSVALRLWGQEEAPVRDNRNITNDNDHLGRRRRRGPASAAFKIFIFFIFLCKLNQGDHLIWYGQDDCDRDNINDVGRRAEHHDCAALGFKIFVGWWRTPRFNRHDVTKLTVTHKGFHVGSWSIASRWYSGWYYYYY